MTFLVAKHMMTSPDTNTVLDIVLTSTGTVFINDEQQSIITLDCLNCVNEFFNSSKSRILIFPIITVTNEYSEDIIPIYSNNNFVFSRQDLMTFTWFKIICHLENNKDEYVLYNRLNFKSLAQLFEGVYES